MEFTKVFACLIAVAALCLCDVTNIRLDAGNPGVGLVNGFGGQPALGGVGQLGVARCNCPLGTVCDIEFGVQRCVPYPGGLVSGAGLAGPVGLGGAIGVGGPIGLSLPIESGYDRLDDYNNPIIGGGGYGRGRRIVGGSGYGGIRKGGLRRCGYMSRSCRATKLDRYGECKYTFDHRRHRCVKVNVCNSCRFANGPDANLFDSMYECERYCH